MMPGLNIHVPVRAAPGAKNDAVEKAREAVSFVMFTIIAAVAVGIGLLILTSIGATNTTVSSITNSTAQTIGTYFNIYVTIFILGGIVSLAALIIKKLLEAFRT